MSEPSACQFDLGLYGGVEMSSIAYILQKVLNSYAVKRVPLSDITSCKVFIKKFHCPRRGWFRTSTYFQPLRISTYYNQVTRAFYWFSKINMDLVPRLSVFGLVCNFASSDLTARHKLCRISLPLQCHTPL